MPIPPRPRIDEMPDDPTLRDVLFEVRTGNWEYRCWREEVNGDIRWLHTFRSKVSDATRFALVLAPVIAAATLAWMVAHP